MQSPSGNADGSTVDLIHRLGVAALLSRQMTDELAASFLAANADEGTIWLVDPAGCHLVAQHNTGPDQARIVGFEQELGTGLISMVFETEQAFCENDIQRNTAQDKRLDRHVGKSTTALIAVPFIIRGETCGVISCVQLDREGKGGGFTGVDLDRVMQASRALQQDLERALAANPP